MGYALVAMAVRGFQNPAISEEPFLNSNVIKRASKREYLWKAASKLVADDSSWLSSAMSHR